MKKHMYGFRAAADGWQQEYSGFMKSIGFTQGFASPCIFVHKSRGIACSVHRDDFTSTDENRELDSSRSTICAKEAVWGWVRTT